MFVYIRCGDVEQRLIDFSQNICPSQCQFRGSCEEGLCVCDAGWSGSDCSNPVNATTDVIRLLHSSTCDVTASNCSVVTLLTFDVSTDENVSCVFQVLFKPKNNYFSHII